MKSEIGGYFEFEQLCNFDYHSGLIALNSGRNALLYVILAKKIKKLYIPYYLCNSVADMCKNHSVDFEFYHTGKDFLPEYESVLSDNEYLYIVNYYGFFGVETAACLKEKYKNIIWDNSHAYFQKPVDCIDTVYSCRKFLGVPDGAYLSTDTLLKEPLERDLSGKRFMHLFGRYEGSASEHYKEFKSNDATFRDEPLKEMSNLTRNLLGAVDYSALIERRKTNFGLLNEKLGSKNSLDVSKIDIPYAYPFYAENGMAIKKLLAAKKIYVATLWPNVIGSGNLTECDYTANILPLPCDQRYGGEEMEYVAGEVLKCIS